MGFSESSKENFRRSKIVNDGSPGSFSNGAVFSLVSHVHEIISSKQKSLRKLPFLLLVYQALEETPLNDFRLITASIWNYGANLLVSV